jgi:methyl-accepting chemotaxis protein
MEWSKRKYCEIWAPSSSLRQRVAYSLALVRLILVPVLFLAAYYLFVMGRIVDRIVNIDAPASQMAQQASIQMLEARRAERSYFLLFDADSIRLNQGALENVRRILGAVANLDPEEEKTVQKGLAELDVYQARFLAAVSQTAQAGYRPLSRVQEVVKDYEKDLNDLLKARRGKAQAKLLEELRTRVGAFDSQIEITVQQRDPSFEKVTQDLEASSQAVLQSAAELEKSNWDRVETDQREARRLLHRAEWVMSIVSGFALLLSIWISFILPRQVVAPLIRLKEAVDLATMGDYEIEFNLRGTGEIIDLAKSLQKLTATLRRGRIYASPTH